MRILNAALLITTVWSPRKSTEPKVVKAVSSATKTAPVSTRVRRTAAAVAAAPAEQSVGNRRKPRKPRASTVSSVPSVVQLEEIIPAYWADSGFLRQDRAVLVLPDELISLVTEYLRISDQLNLFSTCKALRSGFKNLPKSFRDVRCEARL
jgi:hypothetical protein